MGIENEVIAKYGREYWDENKKDILKRANKRKNLNTEKVEVNSRERRRLRRLAEREDIG